ncbi:hypothetical protein [Methylobacterium sp. Leaf125]|uniref:hypothetical protein n=1 Tax=Methylobacterium sp. Leaf125 TaxID=1736265 RepID=UPI000AB982D3|nr:hypothetical protein [Methylobacterium sp. Leaf125]
MTLNDQDLPEGKSVELSIGRLFEILGALHDDGILEKASTDFREDLFQRDVSEIPAVANFLDKEFGTDRTIRLQRVVEKVVEKIKTGEASAVVNSVGAGLLLFPAEKAKGFLDHLKNLQEQESFDEFSANFTLPQAGIDIPDVGESVARNYRYDRPRVRFECGTCVIRP